MELIKTSDENPSDSFDPTPNLKSSSIPVYFIPFNKDDKNCFYCGNAYNNTLFCNQKYCKGCLSIYINYMKHENKCIDLNLCSMNLECEHSKNKEMLIQNFQEWCENCSGIPYMNQIPDPYNFFDYLINDHIKNIALQSEKFCKMCKKIICKQDGFCIKFNVYSNCYLISFG